MLCLPSDSFGENVRSATNKTLQVDGDLKMLRPSYHLYLLSLNAATKLMWKNMNSASPLRSNKYLIGL